MTDFSSFTDIEVVKYAVAKQHEFGCDGLSAGEILDGLKAGSTAIEKRPFGFALVTFKPGYGGGNEPFLWLLYVSEDHRGKRFGHRFVLELKKKYMSTHHMALICYGTRRRTFFGRLGFRIESQDGDLRLMTTKPAGYYK
jgi:GNAT superfamily N-acetyltransferase